MLRYHKLPNHELRQLQKNCRLYRPIGACDERKINSFQSSIQQGLEFPIKLHCSPHELQSPKVYTVMDKLETLSEGRSFPVPSLLRQPCAKLQTPYKIATLRKRKTSIRIHLMVSTHYTIQTNLRMRPTRHLLIQFESKWAAPQFKNKNSSTHKIQGDPCGTTPIRAEHRTLPEPRQSEFKWTDALGRGPMLIPTFPPVGRASFRKLYGGSKSAPD